MFKIGNTVKHKTAGICIICDIVTQDFGAGKREYYILNPLYKEKDLKIMVPITSTDMISTIMNKEKATLKLENFMSFESIWDNDYKKRRVIFSQIINEGSFDEICTLASTLHQKKDEYEKNGKHMPSTDIQFLERAENIIFEELSASLNIKRDEMYKYITDYVDKNKGIQ